MFFAPGQLDPLEQYHTHIGYTLSITILMWLFVLWYGQRQLRHHPSQRVFLYGLVIGLPVCGEIGSYLFALLRPALDRSSGLLISRLHLALLQWIPLDSLLDLFLSPERSRWLLAGLALLGSISLGRAWYAALLFKRLFRQARPLDQTPHAVMAQRLRAALGANQALPPVLIVDQPAPIACTIGVLRPRVYVSTSLLALLEPDEFVGVFCHEWAHILRRDLLWNWLVRLFRDTLCFLPGSYLFWRQMITSQDEACDTLAAKITHQPLVLARALVKVAQAWQASSTIAPAANLLALPDGTLQARVKHLLRLSEHGHTTSRASAYYMAVGLLFVTMLPVILGC